MDLERDTYFRLPALLQAAFHNFHTGAVISDIEAAALLQRKILVETTDDPPALCAPPWVTAQRSVLERPAAATPGAPPTALGALITVPRLFIALRRRRLKDTVDAVIRFRDSRKPPPPASSDAALEAHLCAAAQAFLRARRHLPLSRSCLLDSLALLTHLGRCRLSAQLVFGISIDPFCAHCWVQAGDLVLNDTVGNVRAYTPIRVL